MDPWLLELLGIALAVALSPFPILAIVPLLAGGRGGIRSGAAFTTGWIFGLLIAAGAATAAFERLGARDEAPAEAATWVAVAKVLLALVLLVVAASSWRGRPRAGDDAPPPPGWMSRMSTASVPGLVGIGVTIAALNPKILVLAIGAGAIAAEAAPRPALAVVAFTVVGSVGPLLLLLVALAGGDGARRLLDRAGYVMSRHGQTLVALVLAVLGVVLLLDGASVLTR